MNAASMSYERFAASSEAKELVEHVWLVQAPALERPRREILIPNGRPTVVVCLADPGTRFDPVTGASFPNDTVVFGVSTRPFVLEQLGPSVYLGAQLRPWGLAGLLPEERLVDDFRRLADRWGAEATRRLETDLRDAVRRSGADAADLFLRALTERATPLDPATVAALQASVGVIEESRGMVAVAELAERVGYSAAGVYRLFRRHVGVSPKQFCEIVRYFHFTGSLLTGPGPDSAALLARLHGYYDQAHAARHFKRFTGVSAGRFLEVTDGIARLMHANDSYKTG